MKKGLYHKMQQNDTAREYLILTEKRQLAEARRSDLFWGTGMSLGHAGAADPNAWRGQNNLGKILAELRDSLQ